MLRELVSYLIKILPERVFFEEMLKLQYKGSQRSVWLVGPTMKIGSGSDNDLVLSGAGIAALHAELSISAQSMSISPVASNSVKVNDEFVGQRKDLNLGDVISIADREFKIVDPVRETGSWQALADDDGGKNANKVAATGSGSGWILQGNHKSLRNKRYPVNETVVLGRASDCDLDFSYDRLSRRHAELKVHKGMLYVRDLNSSNGTLVNGKKVSQSRLINGDVLSFDKLSFTIVGPGSNTEGGDLFGGDDLNKTVIRPALDAETINRAAKAEKAKGRRQLASDAVEAMSVGSARKNRDGSTAILAGAVVLLFFGLMAWMFLS